MPELEIYLASGGSGRTGLLVLRACLAQFPERQVEVRQECSLRTAAAAEALVDRAAAARAVICHTLVEPAVRRALVSAALARDVPCIDILGPTLAVVGERLAQEPVGQAGLLYALHREQFDRLDAVDFTMAHDDGQRLHDLQRAEVVLVGLSRVSKSVTCFYLAARGLRAANVPLVAGVPVPPELLQVDPRRVFGLTMNAAHLAAVRHARLKRIAGQHEVPHYVDKRELNREIHTAEKLIADQGWTRIDVSYKATEEVASEILYCLRRQPGGARQ